MPVPKLSAFFTFLTINLVFLLICLNPDAIGGNQLTRRPPSISYKIIPSLDNTWGYDIYLDGKLAIHQSSIPALSGNKGFATKAQAVNVAKAVVRKIKNGMMPPTITQEELKILKAI